MGTDIIGAFSHDIPFPPTDSLVDAMCAGIQPVSPIIHNQWTWDSDYSQRRLKLLRDLDGLFVWFGPRAAIISSGFEWPNPYEELEESESIISAMCAVARFFQSPRLIFLPDDIEPWCYADDWIADGLTLDELQYRLAGIKKPSHDFRATTRRDKDSWEVDGYLIKDL